MSYNVVYNNLYKQTDALCNALKIKQKHCSILKAIHIKLCKIVFARMLSNFDQLR